MINGSLRREDPPGSSLPSRLTSCRPARSLLFEAMDTRCNRMYRYFREEIHRVPKRRGCG
jgi:hypothetical protein